MAHANVNRAKMCRAKVISTSTKYYIRTDSCECYSHTLKLILANRFRAKMTGAKNDHLFARMDSGFFHKGLIKNGSKLILLLFPQVKNLK